MDQVSAQESVSTEEEDEGEDAEVGKKARSERYVGRRS